MSDVAPLVSEAFQRFGTSLLWNVRVPEPDAVDHGMARRLARRLAREGGGDAVDLAGRILDRVEGGHAGELSERDPAGPRR